MKKIVIAVIAIAVVIGAIAYFNANPRPNKKLAVQYAQSAWQNEQSRNFEQAIKDYDMAIKYEPHPLQLYVRRGEDKLRIADFEGAKKDFNKVLEVAPNDKRTKFLMKQAEEGEKYAKMTPEERMKENMKRHGINVVEPQQPKTPQEQMKEFQERAKQQHQQQNSN